MCCAPPGSSPARPPPLPSSRFRPPCPSPTPSQSPASIPLPPPSAQQSRTRRLGPAQRLLEPAPPLRHGLRGRSLQRSGPAALPDGELLAERRDLGVELQHRPELRVVGHGAVAARAQASPGERGGGGHRRGRGQPPGRGHPPVTPRAADPPQPGRGGPPPRPPPR